MIKGVIGRPIDVIRLVNNYLANVEEEMRTWFCGNSSADDR